MSKINYYLKKIDYLGPNFHITFQGEERKRSFIGALFTSMIIGIFITGICLIGQEIVYKEKPYVAVSEYSSKDGNIDFKPMRVHVVYTNTAGRPFPPDSPFYEAIETTFELYEIILTDGVLQNTYFKASSRLCTYEDFRKTPNEDGKCIGGTCDITFCLDENKMIDMNGKPTKKEFYLNNEYGQIGSAFVQIKTQLCNEKLKPGCRAGLKGINSFISSLLYLQNSLDITNFSNPISVVQKGHTSQISLDMFRRDFIHLQMGTLEDDSGYILSDFSSKNYFNTDSASNFTLLYSETNRNLYGVNFDISSNKLLVKRQYMKLQELIASIGGFVKALMLGGSVLLSDYSDSVFYNHFVTVSNIKKVNRDASQTIRFNKANPTNVSNLSMAISKQPLVSVSFWQYLLHKIGKNSVFVDNNAINNLFDIHHLAQRIRKLEMIREEELVNNSEQNKE